jgi:hypothetical protein
VPLTSEAEQQDQRDDQREDEREDRPVRNTPRLGGIVFLLLIALVSMGSVALALAFGTALKPPNRVMLTVICLIGFVLLLGILKVIGRLDEIESCLYAEEEDEWLLYVCPDCEFWSKARRSEGSMVCPNGHQPECVTIEEFLDKLRPSA